MLKRILMNTNSTMVLDFEKNIVEIEAKIEGLKLLAKDEDVDIAHEVNRLQQKLEKQVKQSYANLTPWQKSQVARHPDRVSSRTTRRETTMLPLTLSIFKIWNV